MLFSIQFSPGLIKQLLMSESRFQGHFDSLSQRFYSHVRERNWIDQAIKVRDLKRVRATFRGWQDRHPIIAFSGIH
jgi:hypothetical protein